jgi:molybdopterin molybdotransferase
VKAAVEAEGRLDLWQISMKPGKPLAFGQVRGVPFIGLPGNPVSSFVTFLLFARPFILMRQGVSEVAPQALLLRADFDLPKPDRRREFLRARINADGGLELFPNQNSAVLTSVAWADGLIDNPPAQPVRAGDIVRYLPFAELLS